MWGLVDFNTMEMVNIENFLLDNPNMKKFVSGENDLKFNKIQLKLLKIIKRKGGLICDELFNAIKRYERI